MAPKRREDLMAQFHTSSQKASIAELKVQLDEERDQRREEREKATVDLKAAVQRAQLEAQEELQRLSGVALKREKEQQEVINKLEVRVIFLCLHGFPSCVIYLEK